MDPRSISLSFLLLLSLSGCPESMPPPVGADAGPAPDGGGAADVLVLPDTPLPPGDGGELADGGLPTVDAPLPGDACASVFFADDDMDGFGDAADSIVACAAPAGFVAVSGDCDDADLDVSPDATERCEAARVDDDCDGMPNDGCECDESTVRPCPGDSDVGECVPGTQTCDAE